MNIELYGTFNLFNIFIILLFITGLYCLVVTRNLLRALIGIEILIKAVTLLIIVVGYVTGNTAFSQSLVVTVIIIEVAVIAVAAGVVLGIFGHNNSLDARNLRNLKG